MSHHSPFLNPFLKQPEHNYSLGGGSMDSGIGSWIPDLKTDSAAAASWVPPTPSKPSFTPICKSGNENTHQLSLDFCLTPAQVQGRGFQKLFYTQNEAKMSYGNLLALAESANKHKAFTSLFTSHNTGGSASCSRPTLNLNFPPVGDVDSSSSITSFQQLPPISPPGVQNRGIALNLNMNEMQVPRRIEEGNDTLQEKVELSVEEVKEVAVDLAENQKPDKGGEVGTEVYGKTPQQKPRRKKHRPKVVVEGKGRRGCTPRTPSNTPGTEEEGKTKRRRRTNMQRKVVDKPATAATTPSDESPNVINHPPASATPNESSKVGRKRCKRNQGPAATTPTCEGSIVIDLDTDSDESLQVGRRHPAGPAAAVTAAKEASNITTYLENMPTRSNQAESKYGRKIQGSKSKKCYNMGEEGCRETTTSRPEAVSLPKRMNTCKRSIYFPHYDVNGDFPDPSPYPAGKSPETTTSRPEAVSLPKRMNTCKRSIYFPHYDVNGDFPDPSPYPAGKSPETTTSRPEAVSRPKRMNTCKRSIYFPHYDVNGDFPDPSPYPAGKSPETTTSRSQAVSRRKRTCKRSIFFPHNDANEGFPNPSPNPAGKFHVLHQLFQQELKDDARLTEVDIAYEDKNEMNSQIRKSILQPGIQVPLDPSTPSKLDASCNNLMMARHQVRGKCKIVFSDDEDKSMYVVGPQCVKGSQNHSSNFRSHNVFLTERATVSDSKMLQHSSFAEEEQYNTNVAGLHWNSLQAYKQFLSLNRDMMDRISGMHFPTIHKKKRTEKGHVPASPCAKSMETEAHHMTHACQFEEGASLAKKAASGSPPPKHLPTLNIDNLKRKRSKGLARVRDAASLDEVYNPFSTSSSREAAAKQKQQQMTMFNDSCMIMGTHVADDCTTMVTKKHAKRNSLNGHLLALTWKDISPIDEIAQRLRCLNINNDHQGRYTLGTGNAKYQRETSLVLYPRDGTIAPFVEVKKRRPRPKVDLDDETTRVWKLLLQDINSQGIDGTDEEKAKWWEEERKVFRGRADSFIARMRLVQGDRRFSPWKGSVVDSVVGVFLTQNVSDHLSSSAFMSLAARFPLKSNTRAEFHGERPNLIVEEPVCVMEPDEKITWHEGPSNKPTPGQDSMALRDIDGNEEVINSELTEDTLDFVMSTENSTAKHFSSSEKYRDVYHGLTLDRPASWINKEEASSHISQTETDIVLSSQNSGVFSQNFVDSSHGQTADRKEFTTLCSTTSFVQLLEMAGTSMLHGVYHQENSLVNMDMLNQGKDYSMELQKNREDDRGSLDTIASCSTDGKLPGEHYAPEQSDLSTKSLNQATNQEIQLLPGQTDKPCSSNQIEMNLRIENNPTTGFDLQIHTEDINYDVPLDHKCPTSLEIQDITERAGTSIVRSQSISDGQNNTNLDTVDRTTSKTSRAKGGRPRREKEELVNWDILREEAQASGKKREKTMNTSDSLDWEAVRCANVHEIAETIKERGMNNMLAERIQEFLNRLVKEHGSTDLEWLRDVPPDKAKEYLLSFRGLGLKSVECVRLLTLHHLAFPVDTNVGRIAVRLGWVPLQPLPESLQLHLLELYPILESIQKYLWPRLCKLDQGTLYELHYHMITFGKVFCTKSKPNCNACPMRGECRHFASAFASARLALPAAPEEKRIVNAIESKPTQQTPRDNISLLQLSLPESCSNPEAVTHYGGSNSQPIIEEPATPEPIVEVPATPVQEQTPDIEDAYNDDSNEIPTINLNLIQFAQNVKMFVQNSMELNHVEMSNALVALTPEAASIPMPKLKNISRLRTEHHVYELPDHHPLLDGLEKRDPDDPCSYLLAIWTPGETASSIKPPERLCNSQELGKLCHEETCFACNSFREAESQTVRGTILIPCRTAMRGSFPLNGTYFQVNEVFADHESSLNPIDVPRDWLWDLHRKTVFFGTSIPTIFKGLSTEDIQHCFWRGYVCVRGFERKTRAPRPLMARLHFPASKMKTKASTDETKA
ncbi:unnamed protein product [Cuscuta epithymum]|uniref:HhH-GPD domain-containing protein n=1 Tax=Cuscuta epithymum TaxID=186058 RepID=A0AAV0FST0_9ASTE|nr:unnamed protein product [Cuscuta epithymum]